MSKRNILFLQIFFIFVLAIIAAVFSFSQFLNIKNFPNIPFRTGLDLQGGTRLIYEADVSQIKDTDYSRVMDGLKDIIERRVNIFGVQEPLIQTQKVGGKQRLIVELAGVKDIKEAIDMIGQTPYLEFREMSGETTETNEPIFSETELTGRYLQKAEIGFDETTYKPVVMIEFNSEGSKLFEQITARNIGKQLAIFIDGIPISAPVVNEKIPGGKARITGEFTVEYAKKLAENLSAGALPVPITLVSEQTVGPTLGQISLDSSVKAGLIGFIAVIIFMILIYRFPGLIASIALIMYVIFVLAIFKLIPVTLTLSGIAGFILSIGMAVDANILIFARTKEELKEGEDLNSAVENGFKRAWPSIRDGNATTLIVAVILFAFGASFLKGFSLTLSIGVLMSILSAVFITRIFLLLFAETKIGKIKFLWF
ncbi:MAG: protein translocase subunit SecD [bacterium]|nr:protein translocase subunit SecD [bacterium]